MMSRKSPHRASLLNCDRAVGSLSICPLMPPCAYCPRRDDVDDDDGDYGREGWRHGLW